MSDAAAETNIRSFEGWLRDGLHTLDRLDDVLHQTRDEMRARLYALHLAGDPTFGEKLAAERSETPTLEDLVTRFS